MSVDILLPLSPPGRGGEGFVSNHRRAYAALLTRITAHDVYPIPVRQSVTLEHLAGRTPAAFILRSLPRLPLAYVIPSSASDDEYEVRLLDLDLAPEQRAQVTLLLIGTDPGAAKGRGLHFPMVVKTFPVKSSADQLAKTFEKEGANVDVVHQRRWTAFYFRQALGFDTECRESFPYFAVVPNNPFLWECFRNSLVLALLTTLTTTILCLPLARWFTRYRFRGRTILSSLLLVPLILPPFVGAIGMERLLGRFGTLNLWLVQLGLEAADKPIDWLGGGGFVGVVLMQVLHLYPILYLNVAAAWANIDPTLEDAARNLGAGEFHLFRTVTFPLLLPGYFAGATLVFVWAFTDLGTPLVFGVDAVIPVQIYNQVSDPQRTNPTAYALVVVTLVVTATLFYLVRWVVSRQAFIGGGKGARSRPHRRQLVKKNARSFTASFWR